MGNLSWPENTVWLAASKAFRFICKAARTCNSVSHLLKSVVREICTLRCVGAGTGRPGLRPGGNGQDFWPSPMPIGIKRTTKKKKISQKLFFFFKVTQISYVLFPYFVAMIYLNTLDSFKRDVVWVINVLVMKRQVICLQFIPEHQSSLHQPFGG